MGKHLDQIFNSIHTNAEKGKIFKSLTYKGIELQYELIPYHMQRSLVYSLHIIIPLTWEECKEKGIDTWDLNDKIKKNVESIRHFLGGWSTTYK